MIFRVGQQVRMTPLGVRSLIRRGGKKAGVCTGVVTGFGKNPQTIKVLRDGYWSPGRFHVDFWEPIEVMPTMDECFAGLRSKP